MINLIKLSFLMQAHASKESMVEDHCIQYALSTSEPEFSTVCNHLHSLRCQDCRNIDSTLETIKTKAEDFPWQNKEATMYMVNIIKIHLFTFYNMNNCAQSLSPLSVLISLSWFLSRTFFISLSSSLSGLLSLSLSHYGLLNALF